MISVICPVFNEAKNIQHLIDFFVQSKPADKELILIDGGSDDGTIEIIQENVARFKTIRLLHNPEKIVPVALNLAIPECNGEVIVRLDGHSAYEMDYFERILLTFSKTHADIVGGPTRTRFKTKTQEAIAYTICHPAGIGNSKVHDEKFEGYTDSVTFGAWKKQIFHRIGLFDERLVRNQDDEFHYRAKSKNLKIYQDPAIKLYYFPRQSFSSLFKQYFQYGLYKPMVLMKINSGIKIRHIVPSSFVLYLVVSISFSWNVFFYLPLFAYLTLVSFVSFFNRKSFDVKIRILLALPCLHIAYGSGFIKGLGKLFR
jgi:succinoglycan biosynthesis protein ExoA